MMRKYHVRFGGGLGEKAGMTSLAAYPTECTAELKAVEHLRINALTKQQIKGFVGKKLWG